MGATKRDEGRVKSEPVNKPWQAGGVPGQLRRVFRNGVEAFTIEAGDLVSHDKWNSVRGT